MSNLTVVLTGGSDGIGAEAARALSKQGAQIILLGRSPEKTQAVADEIGATPIVADFADLSQVRDAAEKVLSLTDRIDVLANNAGGIFPGNIQTVDGHELMFQVNHLAPFLFTKLLYSLINQTPNARIINTSSIAQLQGRINLNDLDSHRWFNVGVVYWTTKLENLVFTRQLAKLLDQQSHQTRTACFHPGIVRSSFGQDVALVDWFYNRIPSRFLGTIDSAKGATPLVELALRPDIEKVHGEYFHRHLRHTPLNPQAFSKKIAKGLWERSDQLIAGFDGGIGWS